MRKIQLPALDAIVYAITPPQSPVCVTLLVTGSVVCRELGSEGRSRRPSLNEWTHLK